ncbi:MAG: hypothetical protein Q4D02_06925 [Clostridia bacterium]|nr:hypothetical protein [Clostridia bacterium]
MKKEELNSIINDLNQVEKMRSELSNIRTRISNPIEEIIQYGLEHFIISSTADVVYISKNISDILVNDLMN